jgi:TRAP-type C4-dicarboxylate transport system permease small subunit
MPVVRCGAILAGYALVGLSLLVGFEVIARKFFNFSLQGVDEIGGYVLACVVAFGISFTLLERAHTRIDVVLGWLPRRLQPILHFLAFLSLGAFAVFMAWRAATTLDDSIAYQSIASTPLQTPLWIPQSIWVVGLLIFAVLSTAMAIHAGYLLVRHPDAVNANYGARTIREEIEAELGEAERRGDPAPLAEERSQ